MRRLLCWCSSLLLILFLAGGVHAQQLSSLGMTLNGRSAPGVTTPKTAQGNELPSIAVIIYPNGDYWVKKRFPNVENGQIEERSIRVADQKIESLKIALLKISEGHGRVPVYIMADADSRFRSGDVSQSRASCRGMA